MDPSGNDIGVVGLGVMGRNLVLNIADHGFAVAAYNRTETVTREFASEIGPARKVQPCYTLGQLVESVERPRRILIMVQAGAPVDAVIGDLVPLLGRGDTIIDGGNSYFKDTERREKSLVAKGIHFFGLGISGGEYGARTGPSLMPGGPQKAYESLRGILEAVAARADGEKCVTYLGPGAAGHYVKMVHNGIEYGLMQLIADSYALLKQVVGLSNEELAAVYAEWDAAELESYLIGITAHIFSRRDDKTGGFLVDLILGEAGQLGTGMWTSQSAMDLHVPGPSIDIAVAMRSLSALDDQRQVAMTTLRPEPDLHDGARLARPGADEAAPRRQKVEHVRNALYASVLITYAQGFAHLRAASESLGFGLRLEDVASVWRGGCIIRSAMLRDIKAAFRRRPGLPDLLLDAELSKAVASRRNDLAAAVKSGVSAGVAVPGLMTALAYLDAYRAKWLPSNLIQAQRDYFGAHTYKRTDEEGIFHTDWLGGGEES